MKKQTIKNLTVILTVAGLFAASASSLKANLVVDCSPKIPVCQPPSPPCKPPCPPPQPPPPHITSVPEPSTIVAGALLLLPLGVSTLRILRRNKAE
jgi:hypothetical protein